MNLHYVNRVFEDNDNCTVLVDGETHHFSNSNTGPNPKNIAASYWFAMGALYALSKTYGMVERVGF